MELNSLFMMLGVVVIVFITWNLLCIFLPTIPHSKNWRGIADFCCKDENITIIGNYGGVFGQKDIGQCKTCKRIFEHV